MLKRRLISMALSVAMILGSLAGMTAVSAAPESDGTAEAAADEIVVDFTTMSSVPVYSAAAKQGFVSVSGAIRAPGCERKVAEPSQINISSAGASITESNGSYLYEQTNKDDGGDYNRGGLIYRIDTGAPGAYHIEVEVLDASNTTVAPTGMDAGRLTSTNTWDNAGLVKRTASAVWEENKWSYDFATGEDFVEIEIEPSKVPTAEAPQTVGVKSIKLTPLAVNAAGDKPTIHILGDSTQKTYTFNETISSWGQTLYNYFDLNKVNVINYSMGGRAMKSNYSEGRFDEVLISGKQGDYVFLHSAHNDETVSKNRFSRGSGIEKDNLSANNASYNTWLDMYMKAIKARGMTPVLVTAMPRTGSGKYSESDTKPNGFNPDSPGNMRAKAKSDSEIGLVELYEGAKKYIDSLDSTEVSYIYNSYEAGETPAQNAANGTGGDGTHYRESASKQWCRIMLQSIYDQANAATDTYTDKAIMQKLVSYMPQTVQNAAKTGDWSAVFPEMASDVSAVGVVPGATKQAKNNYYYRTNIEKALELGALHKDKDNNFKPMQIITVGEFARGVEKVFGLEENSLTNYTKPYSELKTMEVAAVSDMEVAEVTAAESSTVDAAADEYTITVQQPVGGTVTIYNDSAYKTKTTDITGSVSANQVLSDNEYYKFTAPSEIVKKTDKSGVFASNPEITTAAIEVRNNGTKQPIYEAKADGILTLYLMFVDHKIITCENTTDGTKATKYINDTEIAGTTQANHYNAVTFNVKAGKTYQVYTNGGTGRLFGIQYSSTDYPQSTESLVVNAKDTIRVVATPDEYYINGSIIVDGEAITTDKEGTFEATSNSTVTATFTKEPDLVENTPIASDAALTREAMAAILYDAYQLADKTNIDKYISQNGGVPSPSDPNYDPNIKYEGTPYIPLAGWGTLTDKGEIEETLFQKFKVAYNLGLIRSEQGIARSSIACGNELEPKTEVTRAKAAKSLVFCYILNQPFNGENQVIPGGVNHAAETAEIVAPNPNAPKTPYISSGYTYEITKAEYGEDGQLAVELAYTGSEASPKAKLIVAAYDKADEKVLMETAVYDVEGTNIKDLAYNVPEDETVKVYVWDGLDTMVPLSAAKTVVKAAPAPATAPPTAPPTAAPTATPTATPVPYDKKATVVTASGDATEFTTIRDAVAKAKEINPQSEAQRVTINVNPGNYEEQVVFDDMKFVTLQQTPNTEDGGRVNLSWYFCTGYCTSNTDLTGAYDPTIDWSRDETWNGYKEGDEKFTKYNIGQKLEGITKISYYDINGNVHKDVPVNSQLKNLGGLGWSYDKMAALIIKKSSSDITVKDLNVVNSVPVMKIAAEESGHLTPEEGSTLLDHSALSICSEDTPMVRPTDDIYTSSGAVDKEKFKKVVAAGRKFNAGESAWLLRSSIFNERGHALATLGDRIVFENVRARGNQDSIWASDGRAYFKNCTLIGGTDYIYGSAAAVFDSCKLGFAGFTDYSYGNPLGTPNTSASRNYGYLFWNCTIYNECDNGGKSNFGGPWGADGQSTFYNATIDDAGKIGNSKTQIEPKGWGRFGAENGLARLYEYGTKNTSGKAVDLSQRVVNKSIEEGGTGMGTVLDEWQILEFNPRNYFSKESNDSTWADSWDPMSFGETYLKNVDAAIASAAVTVPEGDATEIAFPAAPDGIEFKWESASNNAVVTSDGKLQVIRPAAGEDAINTTVTLYARDSKTGYGDKKDVNVTINPTTDTTNVFNIPVTVTQSASIGEDNTYTVTITKNGALIKEQQITLAAGQTTAAATIENIPASASGIDYNVKVVSASGDFTIVDPADGMKTVKGVTGTDVSLAVTANKIVDASVSLDISTAASNGKKTYDLIALAKAKDSANASNIDNSEVIKVSFDVDVEAKPSKTGYVDFSAGTPAGNNSAKADRYTEIKINPSWVQLDAVDCSQGFSGSSNGDGQYLNITGKFAYPSTHNVTVIIDYKAGTVSVSGNGGTPYTFKNFPKDGARGKLNMGVFPESTSDKYTVSGVRLTYKKLVTGEEKPEVVPEGEGIFEFPGKAPNISGGNSCTDADTYAFVNGADEKAVSLFKDATDATKVKASLTANYLNYIGGTADNGSHPSIKISKAGKYRVFYLGFNSDDSTKTATINGKTFTFGAGVDFAASANKTLKLYAADIEVPPSAEGSYLSFDCSSQYLPDLYSIVVAGTTDLGLVAAE